MVASSPLPIPDCSSISCEKNQIIAGYIERVLDMHADSSKLPIRFDPRSDPEMYLLVRRYLLGKRDKNSQFKFSPTSGAECRCLVTDGGREFIQVSFAPLADDF